MCVYSMIADHFSDKWQPYIPAVPVPPPAVVPAMWPPTPTWLPTTDEVEKFRRDVAELERLLERAKKYDAETGQRDCELDEKKQTLQRIADQFGVKIAFP